MPPSVDKRNGYVLIAIAEQDKVFVRKADRGLDYVFLHPSSTRMCLSAIRESTSNPCHQGKFQAV